MQASSDLQWLLIRNYNSKILKRKQNGGKTLSCEKGNLQNLHSYKYSGLVNRKAVYLSKGPNNTLRLQTTKADGKIGALKSGGPKRTQKLKVSNAQQSRKSLADNVKATRPDLTGDALKRLQRLRS